MERLTMNELIAHCDRQLDRLPSGNIMYQEHESVRAYLQMLRHYVGVGTVSEFRALKEAEQKRREGCEWVETTACNYKTDCGREITTPISPKAQGWTTCMFCGRDLRGESHDDN